MNKRILLTIFLIVSLITSSCSISSNLDIQKLDAKEAVTFLASDDMEGRLTGTSGNLHAQRAIEAAYEKIGLEKYSGDSYLVEYKQPFYDPYKQNYSMKIISADNKTRVCIFGEDFMYTGGGDISISTPIVTSISDIGLGNCAVLLDNIDDLPKVRGKVKAALVKRDPFMKGSPRGGSARPTIQISEKLYESIKAGDKSRLEIKFETPREEIKAANVVGKISGKDSKSAIVLCAHFDHVGFARQQVYNGALDNASGTAVLMSLAKKLKAYSEKNKPASDILICAFNGEEYGLLGSASFAGSLKGRYDNIYNINIDCVGQKADKLLLVTGDKEVSQELMTAIQKHLTGKGFQCKEAGPEDYRSDHLSFSDQNYCSVCLGTEGLDTLHTVRDTADTIDFEYLDRLTSAIYDFVTANSEKHFKSPRKLEDMSRYGIDPEDAVAAKKMEEERKNLKFGEYKLIKVGERDYYVANFQESFDSYEKFKEVYPLMKIPESIGKYSLKTMTINYSPDIRNMRDLEFDTVYFEELNQRDINYIYCFYQANGFNVQINFYIFRDNEDYNELSKYFNEQYDIDPADFYVDQRPYKMAYIKGTKDPSHIAAIRQAGARPVTVAITSGKLVEDKGAKGGKVDVSCLDASKEKNIELLKSLEMNKFIEGLVANFIQ